MLILLSKSGPIQIPGGEGDNFQKIKQRKKQLLIKITPNKKIVEGNCVH